MFGFGQRLKPPAALTAKLLPDEHLLGLAKEAAGGWLAASRYGLWIVPAAGEPILVNWSLISKAKWQAPILHLIVADVVGNIAGAEWIVDRHPVNYELAQPGKLTDVIHARVRSGVISSTHHDLPSGGGWVVVRRVPGQDGASVQVRLDPGTDQSAAEEWLSAEISQALAPFRSG